MKNLNKEKVKVIIFCRTSLRKEELEAESKSINLIRDFTGLKKHKMNEIEALEGEGIISELETY